MRREKMSSPWPAEMKRIPNTNSGANSYLRENSLRVQKFLKVKAPCISNSFKMEFHCRYNNHGVHVRLTVIVILIIIVVLILLLASNNTIHTHKHILEAHWGLPWGTHIWIRQTHQAGHLILLILMSFPFMLCSQLLSFIVLSLMLQQHWLEIS